MRIVTLPRVMRGSVLQCVVGCLKSHVSSRRRAAQGWNNRTPISHERVDSRLLVLPGSESTITHCNTLQHTATHCNTLQHTVTHCNTLQHTATHCNTLQHTATHCNSLHPVTEQSYFSLRFTTVEFKHKSDQGIVPLVLTIGMVPFLRNTFYYISAVRG